MGLKIDYKYCPQCKNDMELVNGNSHCATCDITVYKNVVGAAAICIIRGGKVLLSRRAIEPFKGGYDLIGGFIIPGETPEAAAIREAKEETGLEVKVTGLLGIYSDQYGEGSFTLGIHYLGEIIDGEQHAGDDAASLEWVSIDDIPEEALTTGFKNVRESLRDLKLKLGAK
jgi:ADP-ribose pyrophosphatase YjhB (NUDIX family)